MDAATELEPLTDRDRQMLELERLRFNYAGRKDAIIRETFGISPSQYALRLGWIIKHPDAVAYDAQLVYRLQRLRDKRRRHRVGSEAGQPGSA